MKKKAEIILALCSFILCSSFFVLAFGKSSGFLHHSSLLKHSVAGGEREYCLLHQGTPVGRLQLKIRDERILIVLSSLRLAYQFGQQVDVLNANLQAYFNPLGQLFQGRIDWGLPQGRLVLRVSSINPIFLDVQAFRGSELEYEKRFNIPGPILVRQAEPENFEFDFSSLSELEQIVPTSDSGILSGSLSSLQLIPEVETSKRCSDEMLKPLSLAFFSDQMFRVQQQFSALRGLLGRED